jgi:predicted metal-dependent peptidase
MNKDKEALSKLTKARAALILDHPFFGSLALRLTLVEDSTKKTMAVDGKHIFYNPAFVNELSMNHVKFVVAHEVMHCVWQHMTRIFGRKPKKWNAAGDYVINDMLKSMKDSRGVEAFEMPEGGLWSPQFSGPDWTADRVYTMLPDDDMPDAGEEGGAMDEVLPGSNDQTERNELDREWKVATIQAANSARMMGKMPAELERFLGDLMKPQVNWVEKLRAFVMDSTRNDYDWKRPNKRFEDIYMPSLHDETMGEIVVVVDDSGSINQETLNVFGAEIKAIMEDCRPSITHLIFCDAAIHSHYRLQPDDALPLKIHGGGGTDFNPPFKLVAEEDIEPKCLVYLTDLCGPWPSQPPSYPVMWVCVTDIVCPWGETVPIDQSGSGVK